jgi:hypothetical protein
MPAMYKPPYSFKQAPGVLFIRLLSESVSEFYYAVTTSSTIISYLGILHLMRNSGNLKHDARRSEFISSSLHTRYCTVQLMVT